MKKLYLITGATGHLGTVLVSALLKRGETVRALVLPEAVGEASKGVQVCVGDITDPQSLDVFMRRDGYEAVTLVHAAAKITIASREDPTVWATNVVGTDCVMAAARSAGIDRVVYVSSVHAIPERPKGETITEVAAFSPDWVQGQYAKSKAAAAQIALDYTDKGLNIRRGSSGRAIFGETTTWFGPFAPWPQAKFQWGLTAGTILWTPGTSRKGSSAARPRASPKRVTF